MRLDEQTVHWQGSQAQTPTLVKWESYLQWSAIIV
jgi:hypothetical protein